MTRLRKHAEKIVRILSSAGHEAYFAGGCVRDMVMNVEPDDYDIATSALPDQVTKLFRKTLEVGARFGVVIVLIEGRQFEVATFRTESSYSDGRRPDSVEFSTPEKDVKRRDFTINGLLYDPSTKKVLDYVDGQNDIKRRMVRTIGDPLERFGEDRLRMLRAVRFAARLGFEIDPAAFNAVKEMASRIDDVSMERITTEITKMFTGRNSDVALQLMHDSGLLKHALPEVEAMVGIAQPDEFHPEGDVFEHTKKMLGRMNRPSDLLAFSALLHDVGKPDTFRVADRIRFHNHDAIGAQIADEILQRLKFSNEKRRKIVDVVQNHMRFMHAREMRESTLKKLMRRETFEDELELHRIDCLASHGSLDVYDFLVRKQNEFPPEEIKPPPLVSGHDLIEMGLVPGPFFTEILAKIEEMQLEKEITTKKEALAWVRANYKPKKQEGDQ